MKKRYERVVCADGFSMSVQASEYSYCEPRSDKGPYEEVEIGFPTGREPLLRKYAEEPDAPISTSMGADAPTVQTVYPYVPEGIVLSVIEKHGGMVSGELPEFAS